MAENTQDEQAFYIEKFARSVTPLPLEREQQGNGNMVTWGDSNLYPNFLLQLFKTVPLHQSITTAKVNYLIGEGMVNKATGKPLDIKVSLKDTPAKFAQKLAFDFTLFAWFAVGVQYNVFGKPILLFHIPGNQVRTNKAKTKFWICDDWQANSVNQLSYDAYQDGINKDLKTRVYIYQAYTPSATNIYPSVSYESAVTNMVTERLINDFGKNNLEDGFSAAHVISFFKGMPDTEAGRLFTKKVKEAYSGVNGAKYLIDFNNPPTSQSPAAEVKIATIDSPDYTAKLEGVNKKNETNILTAHNAPSRALFGIEQAAGLNGNDLENAFAIFKEVWVKNNRNNLEDGINTIFKALGFPEIEFKDKGSVLPKNLSDTTKEKVYTKNELRAIDGMAPRPDGDVYLEQPKAITAGNSFSVPKGKGRILTDDDFELVKDLGVTKNDFSVLDEQEFANHSTQEFRRVELAFDDAADIDDYLMSKDISSMSTAELRAAIKKDLGIEVTTSELKVKLTRLTDAGVIGDKPAKKSLTRDVQIVYEYQVRAGYGAAIIPGTRGFCKKLINNARYYSRADIAQMSSIFGYDVFKHCGGWYQKPGSDEAENQCRHEWKTVRVIKKAK